jgi:orotate phosphoribosyltransferase
MTSQELAEKIVGWLFQTGAIRVSPADRPFWYTSGLIGPYYVNTHFLYGSEQKASALLQQMDQSKEDPVACARMVREQLWENYRIDDVFRQVTDALVTSVRASDKWDQVDSISGGERRDWFFSMLPAELLGKTHLTIFKDRRVVAVNQEGTGLVEDLTGQKILHISDLITEASSYLRAWIPALSERGASMIDTLTVVDRKQGGADALQQAGVSMQSLVQIDESLFRRARALGYLNEEQLQLVLDYLQDPFASMRRLIVENPAFLEQALAGDAKTQERAKRLIDQDLYLLK